MYPKLPQHASIVNERVSLAAAKLLWASFCNFRSPRGSDTDIYGDMKSLALPKHLESFSGSCNNCAPLRVVSSSAGA